MRKIIEYFKLAWKMSRAYLITDLLRNIFEATIPLVNIFGLGIIIDSITSGKTQEETITSIIIYLSINLSVCIVRELIRLAENNAMRKSSNKLQFEYMENCLDIDYHFVQDGQILSLKQKSMSSQPAFSINFYGDTLNNFIKLIGAFSSFLVLSSIFAAVILVISAVLIFLTRYTQKKEYIFSNEKVDEDRKISYLYNLMTKYEYAKEIRINNAKNFITEKYNRSFDILLKKFRQLVKKKTAVGALSVFLSAIQGAIMYMYFTYQVAISSISIAQYTVMIASTTLFLSVLLDFFRSLGMIGNTLKSENFRKEYESLLSQNNILSKSNGFDVVKIDFSNAVLKFENVSFKYPGAETDTLSNINLVINPRKKLGIVGLNGSGKTTLIKLILRLYSPTKGIITLDGRDISDIPYYQYAAQIGVILQDFSLFAYSLKENIVFDKEFDEELLQKSICISGLNEKLETLPKGINTSVYRELDDNGIEFSGGEGQKLAMARAIYKNANILIFDEPSSALDPIAEYKFFSHLDEISENKTTIFISHRMSSCFFFIFR